MWSRVLNLFSGLQVRYVSRKRLAEARPRVRGQFVKAEVAAAFLAEQVGHT